MSSQVTQQPAQLCVCVWERRLWLLSSREAVTNELFHHSCTGTLYMQRWRWKGKKIWKKRDIRWQVVGRDNDPSQSPRVLTKNSWQTPASGSSAVGFRCLFFYSSALIPMHCLCLALLSIPSATEHNWKNKNPRLSTRHVQKKSKLLKSFLTLMRTQAVIPPPPPWGECKLGVLSPAVFSERENVCTNIRFILF